MRYNNKNWLRKGSFFISDSQSHDLSDIRVLHTGVDTVKQLFSCLCKTDVLASLATHSETTPQNPFHLGDIAWQVMRSSKVSGYMYILKNLDEGFVVMFKSFYAETDFHASHIKIEVTPQCIYNNTPERLTKRLKDIADLFGSMCTEVGIAAHIAVDVKGYEVPKDFESRLVARSKRQFRVNNISNAQYSLNEIATIYGNGQTYTFGSASGLQFCMYEKDQEAIKSDKIEFWESVWSKVPSAEDCFESEYQSGDEVRRFEFRFHHSVIQEFCLGSTHTKSGDALKIRNFKELADHLTPLWKYALNNFRLQHSQTYVDPMWQLLSEDVEIFPPVLDFFYKRGKRASSNNSKRNVAFWLGNVIKLMARKRFKVDHVIGHIMSSGLVGDVSHYFGCKQYGESDELYFVLHDFVSGKLNTHIANGVAA